MILGCVFAHNMYLHICEGIINAERCMNYICSHPDDVFFSGISLIFPARQGQDTFCMCSSILVKSSGGLTYLQFRPAAH